MTSRSGSSGSSTGPGARSRRSALRRPRLPPCRSRAGRPGPRSRWQSVRTTGRVRFDSASARSRALEYPNFELLVIDDGSTDGTAALAEEFGARVVRTENRGLASARNTAIEAARGEIVAFLDDDAYPDPHWLSYVADAFRSSGVAGVGGPNLAALEDGAFARCVAATPGEPNSRPSLRPRSRAHPRLQHGVPPGCARSRRRLRSAVSHRGRRRRHLLAACGLRLARSASPRRRSSGTIGARSAARATGASSGSTAAPRRCSSASGRRSTTSVGHVSWAGRLYQRRRSGLPWRRPQVRYGIWGTGAYQPVVQSPRPPGRGSSRLPSITSCWSRSRVCRPWERSGVRCSGCCRRSGSQRACSWRTPRWPRTERRSIRERASDRERIRLRSLTWGLHLVQPFARLRGRLSHGLTPWRRRGPRGLAVPRPRSAWLWSESWREPSAWIHSIATALKQDGAVVRHGGPMDRWDLEVRGGPLGGARLRGAVEEHGEGKQLVRIGLWPRVSILAVGLAAVFAPLAAKAAVDGAVAAAACSGGWRRSSWPSQSRTVLPPSRPAHACWNGRCPSPPPLRPCSPRTVMPRCHVPLRRRQAER